MALKCLQNKTKNESSLSQNFHNFLTATDAYIIFSEKLVNFLPLLVIFATIPKFGKRMFTLDHHKLEFSLLANSPKVFRIRNVLDFLFLKPHYQKGPKH